MTTGGPIDFGIGFKSFAERLRGERQDRVEIGKRILHFGVEYLDRCLGGIFPNDLILFGAKTGAGKTALATLVAQWNAFRGKRVHYFALEAEDGEIERRIKYRFVVDQLYEQRASHAVTDRLNYLDWYAGRLDDITRHVEDGIERTLSEAFKTLFTYYRGRDFNAEQIERLFLAIQDQTDLIILDHLHYVDSDDPNENRGYKIIVKKIRDAALSIGKPVIVVAHVRKGDRRVAQLLPSVEDFHGTSDVPKIATKAVMIARADADEQPEATPHLINTYMAAVKCRAEGSRTRHIGMVAFNAKKNGYEPEFMLGRAKTEKGAERFDAIAIAKWPHWATRLSDYARKKAATNGHGRQPGEDDA
jgi:DnaB-like helicase C terminal domain